MKLGDVVPDFAADSSQGRIDSFYSWQGASWALIMTHPADFTPVCTTELATAATLADKFADRNVKLLGLSCDTAESHRNWTKDIASFANTNLGNDAVRGGPDFPFAIVADQSRELVIGLGMLDPSEKDAAGIALPARGVLLVSPKDHQVKLAIIYPATSGRNFDEILRAVDSVLLTSRRPEFATPADWRPGQPVMLQPSLSDEDATRISRGTHQTVSVPSGKGYIRMMKDEGQ